MQTYLLADPTRYPHMTTAQLRETFLMDSLYEPGGIRQVYVDLDRTIVGIAAPVWEPLLLPADADLRAEYFTERREFGALNIGGSGSIKVNGKSYNLENLDCLYIGRGNAEISFESKDAASPAIFYLLSYPAHTAHPVALVKKRGGQPDNHWQRGDVQSADRLQVHLSWRRQKLPTGDGGNPPARWKRLEHDASTHAHAAV